MWVEICRTAAFLPAGEAVGPHCQPRLSFPAPTVRCRCFPADIWVTRLSGGRQAGRQAGSVSRQRTRSDQPVITTVSTLPWSLRPKKNNISTALTIFHRE